MNLFTKQKQTHKHRKQTYGKEKGRGINEGFGVKTDTLLYYKVDNKPGPTVRHGDLYSIAYNNL